VGVPLMSDTVFPLLSVAVTPCICTEKETTLAIGASVPITNDGPVSAAAVVVDVIPVPLLQPATASAAPINVTARVTGKNLTSFFAFISVTSFLFLSRKIWERSEARMGRDSLQDRQCTPQIETRTVLKPASPACVGNGDQHRIDPDSMIQTR
jgi:hypothetical protein